MRILLFMLPFMYATSMAVQIVTATVSGHVTRPDGTAVGGAQVSVYWRGQSDFQPAVTTTTSADGEFKVDRPSGKDLAGYCIISAAGLAVGGGPIRTDTANDFQLAQPSSVSGSVLDAERNPISGVEVKIVSIQSAGANRRSIFVGMNGEDRFTARTDAQGQYSFGNLPQNSSVTIELSDPRFAMVEQFNDQVGATLPPLIAHPAATITGKLLSVGSTPVSGIRVFAQSLNGGMGWAEATTDSAGEYTLTGLPAGAYNVMAGFDSSSDWVAAAAAGVNAIEGGAVKAPDMIAVHGALVSGVVTDSASGKPVPGASVGCYGPQRPHSSPAIISATSDDQGRYSLRVAPGANEVYVAGAPAGYRSPRNAAWTNVVLEEGGKATVDFKLDPALSVSGTAVDETGAPIANVSISLASLRLNDWQPEDSPQTETNAAGEFTFDRLASGNYAPHAAGEWQVVSPKTITLPVSGAVKIVLSKLQLSALVGRALDQSGRPLAGVELSFEVFTPTGNGSSSGQTVSVVSGADGVFTLPDLRPDNQLEVTIAKDGYALVSGGRVSVNDDAFKITDVVMAPLNASVSGVVRDDKGNPVAGAWGIAAASGGPARPVMADGSGRFVLTGLPPGSTSVIAAKANLAGRANAVAVIGNQASVNRPPAIDIRMSPVRSLKSADTTRACAILSALHSKIGSAKYYAAGKVLFEVAAYDPDADVRLLKQAGQQVSDMAVMQIIQMRSQVDLQSAVRWGYPRIVKMRDPGAKAESAVVLGLQVAHMDSKAALALYNAAREALAQPRVSSAVTCADGSCDFALYAALQLPALASELHRPETQSLLNNAIEQCQQIRKAPSDSPPPMEFLAACVGAVNAVLGEQVISKLLPQGQPESARGDIANFQKQISSGTSAGRTRLMAAEAARIGTPAMGAAKTWMRDRALGRSQFDAALAACKPLSQAMEPRPQRIADFAFYYARVDPAFSRALLEQQYATDRVGTDINSSMNLKTDAIAMAAVDVDRALEMAYAIAEPNARFDGVRKIAQYVLAPDSVRLTMPFDRWDASDTWVPGTPTMW